MFRRVLCLLLSMTVLSGGVAVAAAPPPLAPEPSGGVHEIPADDSGRPSAGDSPSPVPVVSVITDGDPQVQTADLLAKDLGAQQLPSVVANSVTLAVPTERDGPARVDGVPLSIGRLAAGDDRMPVRSPDAVKVTLVDSETAAGLGLIGFGFQLGAAADDTSVEVVVDFSSFESVYGADFAGRLRLVRFPACVLTDPKNAGAVVCAPGHELITGQRQDSGSGPCPTAIK